MSIKVLYRISDKSNPKNKIPNATKKNCLVNAINVFGGDNLTVFADNCGQETIEMITSLGLEPIEISLGNSKSWIHVAEYAIENYSDDQIVYLLEDDYLHLDTSPKCIEEGLAIADYVSLYDHPDKYINGEEGGNPLVKKGGEQTRVMLTASSHWKKTNSTTMTFACTRKTLKEDLKVWKHYTRKKIPKDFKAFKHLTGVGGLYFNIIGKNRVLISPIPSQATHAEKKYLAPLINWEKL